MNRFASFLAALAMISGPAAQARTQTCTSEIRQLPGEISSTPAPDWTRANDILFRQPACDLQTIAARAYVWGMPLMHAATIRDKFVQGDANRPAGRLNRFSHGRTLAGAESRIGVGVNNDTIYSLAWVDLRDGPLVLTAPDFGKRYYTFSMNFADTSAEQSVGQRTHGGQLPPVFIHGPGYSGKPPAGMVIVASRTRYLLIAGRILVRSPEDYAAVHALQDRIALTRWADWKRGARRPAPPPARPPATLPETALPESLAFLLRLNSILQQWHVLPQDRAVLDSLKALHIGPGVTFDPDRFSAVERAEIDAGVKAGKALVQARSLQLGVQKNGWTINYGGPRFGDDYLLRAGVAKDQPNVAIPEEALYPLARVDSSGQALDGYHRYRLRFPPGALPPVGAFWSVTAYDDKGNMIPNAANRYSVGDRTSGLVRDPDGGVTIELSAEPPAAVMPQNWLPVAKDAAFYLMLRLYQPDKEVLQRGWLPPAIERID